MTLSFDQFKDEASETLNLHLSGYKIKRVQRRTDSLMRRHNIKDYNECLTLLKEDSSFRAAFLNHFTINTSEFFRNPKNFVYLQEEVLSGLFDNKKLSRGKIEEKVKIWSAPCSNGSEPYTVAIILTEMGIGPEKYEILATDLDPEILQKAKQGKYGQNSLKNISDQILEKYFIQNTDKSSQYQLKRKIMNKVKFENSDLINGSFSGKWDLIICRNFFIYLTREQKDELTRKFTEVLNPGGFFFLGNTEFIFTPEQYGLEKVYSSFYKKI